MKLRKYGQLEIDATLDWLYGFLGITHLWERRPETLKRNMADHDVAEE